MNGKHVIVVGIIIGKIYGGLYPIVYNKFTKSK